MADSKDLQVVEFKTEPRGDHAAQLHYYDDIFAAATPEERAKVQSWFDNPQEWSHGSLVAQLGPRESIIFTMQDFLKPETSRFEERLSSSWEHLPCVTTGLTVPVPPKERHLARILKTGGPR